jgi:ABC-type sugar transport system substrate-binding protein
VKRLAVVTACFAIVLSGCTSGSSTPTIGMLVPTSKSAFFRAMLQGAREEARRQGAVLMVANADNDGARQANELKAFVDREVDAIVLDAVGTPRAAAATQTAKDADVPVIAVGDVVPGERATGYVESPNELAGRIAAEYLFFKMGGKGQAAELLDVRSGPAAAAVDRGFTQIARETKTVSIVARRTSPADPTQAAAVAAALFKSKPKLEGVFANTDEIALGVLQAARRHGILGRLSIVGLGGTTAEALRAVKKQQLEGVVWVNAEELGRVAVASAIRAARGRSIPSRQTVDVKLVTKANAKKFLSKLG